MLFHMVNMIPYDWVAEPPPRAPPSPWQRRSAWRRRDEAAWRFLTELARAGLRALVLRAASAGSRRRPARGFAARRARVWFWRGGRGRGRWRSVRPVAPLGDDAAPADRR